MSRRHRKRRKLAGHARAIGKSYQKLRQELGKPTGGGGTGSFGYRQALGLDLVRKAIQHSPTSFEFRIGVLRTPIRVDLVEGSAGWYSVADHALAVPERPQGRLPVADRPSYSWQGSPRGWAAGRARYPAAALREAVLGFAIEYELAINDGRHPDDGWLVPNPRFRQARDEARTTTPFSQHACDRLRELEKYRADLIRAERLLGGAGFVVGLGTGVDTPTCVSWGTGLSKVVALTVPEPGDGTALLWDLALAIGLAETADRDLRSPERDAIAREAAQTVLRALVPHLYSDHVAWFETRRLRRLDIAGQEHWQIADLWVDRFVSESPDPISTLHVVSEDLSYPITKSRFVIGRQRQTCDLVIRDGEVSREHAVVLRRRGRHYIKDLGSVHGLRYLGLRLDNKCIEDGDVFHLAGRELRFEYRH